jgi:hypothetical protein
VLEYVSKNNRRKDYDDNMRKYEQELKVPYYMLFVPDEQELTLYRHTGEKYSTVFPNEEGRYSIPELQIELAILDGWVRYWYRGEVLPLPADLMNQLNETKARLAQSEQQRTQTEQRLAQSEQRLDEKSRQLQSAEEEIARLRAELEKLREQP